MTDDPSHTPPPGPDRIRPEHKAHWRGSLRIVAGILLVWFTVSLGAGVLFRDTLDETLPNIGGAPFGFWMAQQGAILCFILLLLTYRFLMNRLDRAHGLEDRATGGDA